MKKALCFHTRLSLVDPAVPFSNHFYKNLTEIYDLKDMLWNEGIISYNDLCFTITGDKGKKGLPHRSYSN